MANIFKQAENKIVGGLPRTRFSFNKRHTTSFDAGRLIPLMCEETLPGDTWQIDVASLVRMQTPIAPIMDDIYMDFYFFYVPLRVLTKDESVKFDDIITLSTGYGGTLNTSTLPTIEFANTSSTSSITPHCLGDYLGLPIGKYGTSWNDKVSLLPFIGYTEIWNYYFRDENYQTLKIVSKYAYYSNTDSWLNSSSPNVYPNSLPAIVNERHDLFTSVLPAPQKGPAVLLPLGDAAPLVGSSQVQFTTYGAISEDDGANVFWEGGDSQPSLGVGTDGQILGNVVPGQLYADLSQATSATINQLREAIVMQQFLEHLGRSGSRYSEFIKGFFGVEIGDSTLQKPEFIAEYHMNINVNEVIQTSGINGEDGTQLGTTGAVSRSASSSNRLFTYSTSEHGYLYCVACVRHKLSYSQGLDLKFTRIKGTDFYNPAFEGIGEVGVKTRQILAPVVFDSSFMKSAYSGAGSNVDWDDEIGFNEAFAEYKYQTNKTSGIMNPVALESLDYWTLTKAFTSSNITGADIRVASKNTLSRALSITNQPQFIGDFMFHGSVVRKMRKFSTPGLTRI